MPTTCPGEVPDAAAPGISSVQPPGSQKRARDLNLEKTAMTGLSKCEKKTPTRHDPLLLEDFPSGLRLAGNLTLPENSKFTKTSLDTQRFL